MTGGPAARTFATSDRSVRHTRKSEERNMDLVVLAAALIAALVLSRSRALAVAVAVWCVGLTMVGWGPANNDSVDTGSLGFWGPWAIVLGVELLIVIGVDRFRNKRVASS